MFDKINNFIAGLNEKELVILWEQVNSREYICMMSKEIKKQQRKDCKKQDDESRESEKRRKAKN